MAAGAQSEENGQRLLWAAKEGRTVAVSALVGAGADVNAVTKVGLCRAAVCMHASVRGLAEA